MLVKGDTVWHPTIIWTNAGLSFIRTFKTNFSYSKSKYDNLYTRKRFENAVCVMAAIAPFLDCITLLPIHPGQSMPTGVPFSRPRLGDKLYNRQQSKSGTLTSPQKLWISQCTDIGCNIESVHVTETDPKKSFRKFEIGFFCLWVS